MWLTSLGLALGVVAAGASAGGQSPGKLRPTLNAAQFAQRWPATVDGIEKPNLRQKLRRLVQITPDDDPDKARFCFRLAEVETARWRSLQGEADARAARAAETPAAERRVLDRDSRALAGRAQWSWQEAVAAYVSAAAFPTFERGDAALYWLTRLNLARH